MKQPSAWERVEADIEAGRLWKARDRLHGMLVASPADQKILDRLGELYFQMGDHPQAGRYWFLTTREDESARAAHRALLERFGHNRGTVARNIPALAPHDMYPDEVTRRLAELGVSHRREAFGASMPPYQPSIGDRILGTGCAVVALVLLVGVWLVGAASLLGLRDPGFGPLFEDSPVATVVGGCLVLVILGGVIFQANRVSRARRTEKVTVEEDS